jgi:hypothetical protein
VAFGVDQVDGGEDGVESVREIAWRWYAVGGVVVVEFAFGSHDPLRHRRLGHHEGGGDLVSLEASDEAEDQGDSGVGDQGGVGA